MYSRYVKNGGSVIQFDPMENTLDSHRQREHRPGEHYERDKRREEQHERDKRRDEHNLPARRNERAAEKKGGLGGFGNLLRGFHLDLDTGDILILLIILLLFVDGEDNELLLILGLTLFLDL